MKVYNHVAGADVRIEVTAADSEGLGLDRIIIQKHDGAAWQKAYEQKISAEADRVFFLSDIYVATGKTYRYKALYVNANNDLLKEEEGEVLCYFDGLVVMDATSLYVSVGNWSYSHSRTTSVNFIQPFQRKHPIAIVNGNVNYESGDASGVFAPFDERGDPAYEGSTPYRQQFLNYLATPGVKLFKTYDGYMWLVCIDSGMKDTYEYNKDTELVSFSWTEVDEIPTTNCLQAVTA